LLGIESGTST